MTIAFRSPVLRPLHPKDWPRPPGSLDFRVTQRFDDLDSYWSTTDPGRAKQYHRAVDIGNGRCGDPIVAMAPGTAYRLRDNASSFKPPPGAPPYTDALGIRVDHGSGVVFEFWHLDAYAIGADGVQVSAGTRIGTLGKTGLGAVCHCHIEMKVNGSRVDPEPYLFGASYPRTIPDTALEDDMDWRRHARVIATHLITVRANDAGVAPYPFAGPGHDFGRHAGPSFAFTPGEQFYCSQVVTYPADGSGAGGRLGFWYELSRELVANIDAPPEKSPGTFWLPLSFVADKRPLQPAGGVVSTPDVTPARGAIASAIAELHTADAVLAKF